MKQNQIIILAAAWVASGAASGQASFHTVGHLSTAQPISHTRHVSADGSLAFGFAVGAAGGLPGYRWSADQGMMLMPDLPGYNWPEPYAATSSNRFILGSAGVSPRGFEGFIWSETGGYTMIGDLPGGNHRSALTALTDDGSFGVGYSSFALTPGGFNIYRAVSWTPEGGLQPLRLPDGDDEMAGSHVYRMLPDGRLLGYSASGAWLYSDSTDFEMLPGAQWMPFITDDGSMLSGTASRSASWPAYWTREEGLVELALLSGDIFGSMLGMSGDGSVMVGVSQGKPVVWLDRGAPITVSDYAESFGLDMTEWVILNMGNVSADGSTIVGTARHTSWAPGRVEGFVLTIPAPGSACVTVIAGAMASRRRRR